MRLSNNIHNVCELEGAQLIQEWKEEQKIPVKRSPPAPTPPPKPEEGKKDEKTEAPKEGETADAKPAEGGEKKTEEPPAAEQKPEEPAKPVEQEFEIKMRDKKTFSDIKYSTSSFALTPAIKRTFGDQEKAMFQTDMNILQLKAVKNDLEAYAYRMRDICGSYGSHEKYIDPSIKDQFLAQVSQVVDWIYGEGENATLEEYSSKLE